MNSAPIAFVPVKDSLLFTPNRSTLLSLLIVPVASPVSLPVTERLKNSRSVCSHPTGWLPPDALSEITVATDVPVLVGQLEIDAEATHGNSAAAIMNVRKSAAVPFLRDPSRVCL